MNYVFIPLGGSRATLVRTVRNIFITFLIGGLWHGAAWHFVAWGAYWGVVLSSFHGLGRGGLRPQLPRPVGIAITFVVALVGWAVFRLPVGDAMILVSKLATISTHGSVLSTSKLAVGLGIPLLYFAGHTAWALAGRWRTIPSPGSPVRGVYYAALLAVAVVAAPVGYRAFIYFQF